MGGRASALRPIIFAKNRLVSAKIKRRINLNKALRYQALGCAVTYRTDDDIADAPDHESGRGPLFYIVVTVMLACFGSGSALVSRAYGLALPSFASVTSASVASVASPAAPVAAADKPVGLSDLKALQQQIAGSAQSTERLLAAQQAQQAEIKRLSDQVAALSGKLDLLQRPIASAQAALPAPAPKPVVAAKPKKPAAVQTTGSISTGGAPLPPPVPLTR